ncbi:MAG: hypothetical protein ABSG43_28110, partial [Solirubrobacteraceae bacterium]
PAGTSPAPAEACTPLHGAEAILKLRAIASDNDFDQYCNHRFTQGRQRNQDSRYGHGLNPRALRPSKAAAPERISICLASGIGPGRLLLEVVAAGQRQPYAGRSPLHSA